MPHPIPLSTLDAERELRRERLARRILRDAYWSAIAGSLVAAFAAWQHLALRHPLPSLPIGPGIDALIAAFALALLLAAWRSLGLHRREAPEAQRTRGRGPAVASIPGWACLGIVALFWAHIGWLVAYHTFFCPCR